MSSLLFIALVSNQKMLGKWLSVIYICHEWFHEDCVVIQLDVWKLHHVSWKCHLCN